MPKEATITEMVEFDADRVDGVFNPANGMPFLVIKSLPDDVEKATGPDAVNCPTCKATGKVKGNTTNCPTCKGDKKVTPETAAANKPAAKDLLDELTASLDDDEPDPVDDGVPGSVAWETADSDALHDVAMSLAVLCKKLSDSQSRESIEVAHGDTDDTENVWQLSDAIGALQYALGIVSTMCYTELSETTAAKMVELVGEIRQIGASLADQHGNGKETTTSRAGTGDGEEVLKMNEAELTTLIEAKVTDTVTKAIEDAFAKHKPAVKAEGDETATPAGADGAATETTATETAATGTPDATATATPESGAPAPEDTGTTGGDGTKSVAPAGAAGADTDVLKSIIEGAVTNAVSKALEGVDSKVAEAIQRVEKMEQTPRAGGPLGIDPNVAGAVLLRGQERGNGNGDGVTAAARIRKAADDETLTPEERAEKALKLSRDVLSEAIATGGITYGGGGGMAVAPNAAGQ